MPSHKINLGLETTVTLFGVGLIVFGIIMLFVIKKKWNRRKQLGQLKATGKVQVIPPAYTKT